MSGLKLNYLVALLNSKLFEQIYPRYYAGGGIQGELTLFTLEEFPIPTPTPKQEQQITDLVKTILTKKASSTINDTSPEERQIDEIVYGMYGLSEREINIVEGVR